MLSACMHLEAEPRFTFLGCHPVQHHGQRAAKVLSQQRYWTQTIVSYTITCNKYIWLIDWLITQVATGSIDCSDKDIGWRELVQEEDGEKVSQSWRKEIGVHPEELPARIYFQSHGWIFSLFQQLRWGNNYNNSAKARLVLLVKQQSTFSGCNYDIWVVLKDYVAAVAAVGKPFGATPTTKVIFIKRALVLWSLSLCYTANWWYSMCAV